MEDLRTASLGMGRNEARLHTGLNQVNSFNLSEDSQNEDKIEQKV